MDYVSTANHYKPFVGVLICTFCTSTSVCILFPSWKIIGKYMISLPYLTNNWKVHEISAVFGK